MPRITIAELQDTISRLQDTVDGQRDEIRIQDRMLTSMEKETQELKIQLHTTRQTLQFALLELGKPTSGKRIKLDISLEDANQLSPNTEGYER